MLCLSLTTLLLSHATCVTCARPSLGSPSLLASRHAGPSLMSASSGPDIVAAKPAKPPEEERRVLPCGDELDVRIVTLALPAIANFVILPLVGATDLFWVGRMEEALALAGQAAANQVFSTAAWVTSVIPTITTPLVAKAFAANNTQELQARVGEAIFTTTTVSLLVTVAITFLQKSALLAIGSASALPYSVPYLRYRIPGIMPEAVSVVGFAVFRGCLDTVTPLQIALVSNLINVALDPVLIFSAKLGVAGAALATTVSQVFALCSYIFLLLRRKLVRWSTMLRPPSRSVLKNLAAGGAAVQIRALALNLAFISITRRTQSIDPTGTAAAAHAVALQFWQLGGVILFALSTVASIVIPSEMARKGGGPRAARAASNRMLSWGALVGFVLGIAQLVSLPMLRTFSPLPEVQRAAYVPSIMGAVLQFMNGLVFVGEGIMVGTASFGMLAAGQVLATLALMLSLRFSPPSLIGIWGCFFVFNGIRLVNVLRYHLFSGPLLPDQKK